MVADSTYMFSASKLLVMSALLVTGCIVLSPVSPLETPSVVQAAGVSSSAYQPISPIRVADSRNGIGVVRFGPGQTQSLLAVTPQVRAAAGLTAGETVSAVVLNVTIVNAEGPGFVTVWPHGGARPDTSSVNSDFGGHTVANTVTTPVSAGGALSLYSFGGSELIVDVQGVFVAADAAAGGRLVSLAPARALDTRPTGDRLGAGQTRVVDLRPFGVPASASAAVLNVTMVDAAAPGFLTVWPGGPMPTASNLNVSTGNTVANQVMVGLSDGRFSVYTFAGGDLIVDVGGYFTGESAEVSSDGLFVPVTPARILDTRSPSSLTGGAPLQAGAGATVATSGAAGVPAANVGAVALNVTLAHTSAPGFATVWPGGALPNVSSVNAQRAGQVVANHVVASLSSGSFNVFTYMSSHVIADVFGYWTLAGAPGSDGGGGVTRPPGGGGTASSPPATGPHTFLFPMGNGEYARWNPCRVLDYQLNAGNASPSQLAGLAQAIAALEFATGIDLQQVGTTTGGLDGRVPAGARAVIVLTTPSAAPILGFAGGLGGGSYLGSGEVTNGFAIVSTDVTHPDVFLNLMMHELGHMMGLSHVTENGQVMHPIALGLHDYANGDREGLWRVGAAQGCLGSGSATLPGAAALEVPGQLFEVTCGASVMHPVFAGVEVIETGSDGHDGEADDGDALDGASAHESADVVADQTCVRTPVASP